MWKLVAYHIIDRKIQGWNYLTPRNDIGIITTVMNPVDWYETLLPHTMLKFERLTVLKYAGMDIVGERYVNRRYDDEYKVRGAIIERTVEAEYDNEAINGRYFYIDDLLAFDTTTRDIVDNVRIRMDFSTIFPELETNIIRQNGDATQQDPDYDETAKHPTPQQTMNKLFLLDAYALIYRSYYAFIKNPRINSKGMNTSAVMGFVNTLNEIMQKEQPTHIGVAFDHGKTFRDEAFPQYKAQREATPEDIRASVPVIKNILAAMHIPVLQASGSDEADDKLLLS